MPRVLLVDDSALVRNSMHAALEPYGIELVHAENGQVAVDKACATRWDLIFLDVVMPVMDGPTALREIRARGITTPVVLVTSVSTASIVAAAVKLGGVQYISKPFTPEVIVSVATKLLGLNRAILATPPRVLLQHVDPELPRRLAKVLPAHVAIDSSQSLGQSLDRAELGQSLMLFESADSIEEMEVIAQVVRDVLPAAGILAISELGNAAQPWSPQGAIDGVLPKTLDSALGRGFLYPNFLRPLVFVDGVVAHAAGFSGPPEHHAAYLTMLSRTLRDQCTRLDLSRELQLDLRDLDADPDTLVALVTRVNDEIKAAGGGAAFRLRDAMLGAVASQLSSVLMLEAG